jgi:protein-histidine pros-kinase
LAKIESGKVEINLEPIICQSVIEEVATTLRPLAEGKGLKFEISIPDEDIVIPTDRRALSQILLNLSNNAIKFTEKGALRIELARRADNGNNATEISVIDTGVGIQTEDQRKLFDAFVQVGSASSRRHEGTGLGLHLSQKLAAILGGHIKFQSEHGKGSTFTLVIPEK